MNLNRVAVIGECMVELQKSGNLYKQSFGGDTLNTALYLARLTHKKNITTAYITAVGKDPFSSEMLTAWNNEFIDTRLVQVSETKLPGLYSIETTPQGERSFYYWRNDSAARYWLRDKSIDVHVNELSQYQLIYLSGISLAILPEDCLHILLAVLTCCKQQGVKIVFDNNYRPRLWQSKEAAQQAYCKILALTEIAFLTFDDEQMLWNDEHEEQVIARTRNFGVKEIVIKRGGDACYVVNENQTIKVAPKPVDKIIDTTAAGDSFSAGYLAKRLLGGTPEESAYAGHILAGQVIQHPGAIIDQQFMPIIE